MQIKSVSANVPMLVALAFATVLPLTAHAALTSGPTSTVVYVGGNDVVLKSSEGKLLNFTVPPGYKFAAGAKEMTVAELKPGTSLTKPVAPGSEPKAVTAVSVVKGKVYAVTPPSTITLTLSDGAKDFVVPAGTSFTVGGKAMTIGDLKADMIVEATVVTTAAEAGASAPATPPMAGALLVAAPAGDAELPLAGSNLPLYGLAGLCLMTLGAGLLWFRKPATQI